jgi:hypothetical protein
MTFDHNKRRADLQGDIDQFLANGGQIRQFPPGATGGKPDTWRLPGSADTPSKKKPGG